MKSNQKIRNLIIVVCIIVIGACFRFTGINWDEQYHLHPDERFLTMVLTSIHPVESLGEYFSTSTSALNPHNVIDASGNQTFPFFVYGTFPLFLVRYFAEIIGKTGYSSIHIVGRVISGIFDLGTIFILYQISTRIFQKTWQKYCAPILYAAAVLPIQISHYFIVDNFATFFSALAISIALKIYSGDAVRIVGNRSKEKRGLIWMKGLIPYISFSITVALASASKINAIVSALLLPIAIFFRDNFPNKKKNKEFLLNQFLILCFSGIIFLIAFRVFQPYAFKGPGFLNISLNMEWLNNLRELQALSSGLSGYPPSLQWARRSILFPIKNLILFGAGIGYGFFGIVGFIFFGLKEMRNDRKGVAIIWVWSLFYIIWQAIRWNPTMRYFLLIYPPLALMGVIGASGFKDLLMGWLVPKTTEKFFTILMFFLLLAPSILWAVSFIQIYRQPMTRIAASEWIYSHIEGPVNLLYSDHEEEEIMPLSFPHYFELEESEQASFLLNNIQNGLVEAVAFDQILFGELSQTTDIFTVEIVEEGHQNKELISIPIKGGEIFQQQESNLYEFALPIPFNISVENNYSLNLKNGNHGLGAIRFSGSVQFVYSSENSIRKKPVLEFSQLIDSESPYAIEFQPVRNGEISGIQFFEIMQVGDQSDSIRIEASLIDLETKTLIANGSLLIDSRIPEGVEKGSHRIAFNSPVIIRESNRYQLTLRVEGKNSDAGVMINGSKSAKETDWDDALPLIMPGFNPYDSYAGIYKSDLNFQMYWDDNEEKLDRFIQILDQADTIIITSSRQWGSVTQLPEKYPLSTRFYDLLIGCREENIQNCYRKAQPRMYQGELGFSLNKVFDGSPEFLGIPINTQYAEEAFTVYDHPKVFIFKKNVDFNLKESVDLLNEVDLTKVINLPPQEIEAQSRLLTIPSSWRDSQRNSGTWSTLFDYGSFQNKNGFTSAVVWYFAITLIGFIFYPIVSTAFNRLGNNGFGLLKISGLLILSYISWLIGSVGIPLSRLNILLTLIFLVLINGFMFIKNREKIFENIKEKWRDYLTIEIISLVFFVFFLLVRLGNPDLWHPYKGGEKPMDFSYLNAVIKSDRFPPYDPWYAGGFINYYYFGFVIAATPIKLLGIVPSVAYNLILPSFFSFTALGAYTFGSEFALINYQDRKARHFISPVLCGLITAVFLLLIGNLGTSQMIVNGLLRWIKIFGALNFSSFENISLGVKDLLFYIRDSNFGFYPGDWYWIPSRSLPGEPITEFPYFTFLYGDPHAHLFALPLTLLVINWCLNLIRMTRDELGNRGFYLSLSFGLLAIGVLRVTNTWDYPSFLFLGCISIFYTFIRNGFLKHDQENHKVFSKNRVWILLLIVLVFSVTSYFIFYSFNLFYGQAYTSISLWMGDKSPILDFLKHWGFFYYVIISFCVYEFIKWLDAIPLSMLGRLRAKRHWVIIAGTIILIAFIYFLIHKVWISLVVFPLGIVMVLLLLKEKNYDYQFLFFMTMLGLGLSLLVETIVLDGDIGRMNTVFKFYLQSWTFLSLATSIYFVSIISRNWNKYLAGKIWQFGFVALMVAVAMFPIFATTDKIRDRMAQNAPISLDGMSYMKYAKYNENNYEMDLREDYYAIRWVQENIIGTPTIIEANVPEYRWGNRFTIYTGLPGVVGWNWHQRQQRAINPGEWVYERVQDVGDFYSTLNIQEAMEIIDFYDVEIIINGQLEKAIYPQAGLLKLEDMAEKYLEIIYDAGNTTIYRVR